MTASWFNWLQFLIQGSEGERRKTWTWVRSRWIGRRRWRRWWRWRGDGKLKQSDEANISLWTCAQGWSTHSSVCINEENLTLSAILALLYLLTEILCNGTPKKCNKSFKPAASVRWPWCLFPHWNGEGLYVYASRSTINAFIHPFTSVLWSKKFKCTAIQFILLTWKINFQSWIIIFQWNRYLENVKYISCKC